MRERERERERKREREREGELTLISWHSLSVTGVGANENSAFT